MLARATDTTLAPRTPELILARQCVGVPAEPPTGPTPTDPSGATGHTGVLTTGDTGTGPTGETGTSPTGDTGGDSICVDVTPGDGSVGSACANDGDCTSGAVCCTTPGMPYLCGLEFDLCECTPG